MAVVNLKLIINDDDLKRTNQTAQQIAQVYVSRITNHPNLKIKGVHAKFDNYFETS